MKKHRTSAWYRIVLHVILPAGLTILLFIGAIFGVLLPRYEQTFLQQKRQLIRELNGSVYALIENYHDRQMNGELTPLQAQQRAMERIRAMRYGPENKDYFWIHTLDAVMMMHPYRTDLEGQDISDLKDSQGKFLIQEMNKTVRSTPEQAGYVDYMWQWKDDSATEVPKLSYVRLYEPWGWIIGTGIYLDDVQDELMQMTRRMERSVIVILLVVTGLSGYLIWQGVCTEIKRQNSLHQREQLMKSLAIKNDELESVVSIASHDLRSPLVNIEGFSGELEHSCRSLTDALSQPDTPDRNREIAGILNDQIPEYLGFIKSNTQKMKGLINGLLQLSRLGVAELNIESLDMNELMKRVIETSQFQIKTAQAKIDSETLPPCRADSQLLDQVFTNLIDNALKYRHSERTPEIQISGRNLGNTVEYAVADNGIGMEEAHLEKIFEMFHQIRPNGSNTEGVGLGLNIVKRIVDILGGTIRVTSEPNKKTTFLITLPAGR